VPFYSSQTDISSPPISLLLNLHEQVQDLLFAGRDLIEIHHHLELLLDLTVNHRFANCLQVRGI
jgi:hypothetical protein